MLCISVWINMTIQKMKFSIKDFFSICDQICRKSAGNFIFCAVMALWQQIHLNLSYIVLVSVEK